MKQRLFTLVSALSLLLFVAVVVLWARSHSGSDYVSRGKLLSSGPQEVTSRVHEVRWTRGGIHLTAGEHTYFPHGVSVPLVEGERAAYWGWGRLGVGHVGWEELPRRSFWNRLGFHHYSGQGFVTSFSSESTDGIVVPAWLPAVILAIPPLVWVRRVVGDRRRSGRGLCASCGYDLRATPERCPECGGITRRDDGLASGGPRGPAG